MRKYLNPLAIKEIKNENINEMLFIAIKLVKTKILWIIYDVHKDVVKLAHIYIADGSIGLNKHFGFVNV